MVGRTSTGSLALQARILAVLALLVVVYAGIGWLLVAVGVPVWLVVLLAAAVLVAQWRQSERLACAVTNARLVCEHQAPEVHATLDRLCALTGQPKPRVALAHDMAANAFTVGRSRRHTTMIVTWGLLWLDPPELEAAFAHELAHIEHRDVAVMTLASSFASGLVWLLVLGPRGMAERFDPAPSTPGEYLTLLLNVVQVVLLTVVPVLPVYALLVHLPPDVALLALAGLFASALVWLLLLGRRGMLQRVDLLPSTPGGYLTFCFYFIRVVLLTVVPVVAVGALAVHLPLRALSRDRELAADRSAALWLGRPALLAATLVKVHGQRDQIPRTDLRGSGVEPLGLVAGRDEFGGWLASHPPLHRRLAQLDQLTRLLR